MKSKKALSLAIFCSLFTSNGSMLGKTQLGEFSDLLSLSTSDESYGSENLKDGIDLPKIKNKKS